MMTKPQKIALALAAVALALFFFFRSKPAAGDTAKLRQLPGGGSRSQFNTPHLSDHFTLTEFLGGNPDVLADLGSTGTSIVGFLMLAALGEIVRQGIDDNPLIIHVLSAPKGTDGGVWNIESVSLPPTKFSSFVANWTLALANTGEKNSITQDDGRGAITFTVSNAGLSLALDTWQNNSWTL